MLVRGVGHHMAEEDKGYIMMVTELARKLGGGGGKWGPPKTAKREKKQGGIKIWGYPE